jgi:hypothetical protein
MSSIDSRGENRLPEPLLARYPLLSGAFGAAGLLVLASLTAGRLPALAPIGFVFLAGAALSFGGARHLSSDRRLAWIVGGSYFFRSALATSLYVVSAAHLPVFASLQLGGGFWNLAPDAQTYHAVALALRSEGARSGWLPLDSAINLYCGTVAITYNAFVPHPLIPILFGVWAATATTLLAFALVRQVGGSLSRCLTASAAVAFWPSFLVWTSQLLREGLFFMLLFLAYAVMAALLARRRGWAVTAIGLLALALTVVLLSMSRFYAGWVLLASTAAAALLSLATPFAHGRRTVTVCAFVVALGVWIGTTQPLMVPLSPREIVSVLSGPAVARLFFLLAFLASALAVALLARRRGLAVPKLGSLALVLTVVLALGAWLGADLSQSGLGLRAAPGMSALPSFDKLETFRQELAVRGGTMTDMAFTPVSTPYALVKRLPSAAATALFVPVPWRWMPRGEIGAFRTLAGAEVVLIAFLLPGIVAGGVRILRRRSIMGYVMVTSAVLSLISLGIVVANEGTLFRYRLQGLLPLLVIASAGGGFEIYPLAWRRLIRLRPRSTPPSPSAV